MGRHIRTREVDDSLCIRSFPNQNLILTHYIISAWLFHLLYGLGKYIIRPGSFAQVLVIINNIMTVGYTYAKRRINNPPDLF